MADHNTTTRDDDAAATRPRWLIIISSLLLLKPWSVSTPYRTHSLTHYNCCYYSNLPASLKPHKYVVSTHENTETFSFVVIVGFCLFIKRAQLAHYSPTRVRVFILQMVHSIKVLEKVCRQNLLTKMGDTRLDKYLVPAGMYNFLIPHGNDYSTSTEYKYSLRVPTTD
jgi:hypothetical protein